MVVWGAGEKCSKNFTAVLWLGQEFGGISSVLNSLQYLNFV